MFKVSPVRASKTLFSRKDDFEKPRTSVRGWEVDPVSRYRDLKQYRSLTFP